MAENSLDTVRIWGLNACDTSRAARKSLADVCTVDFVDVRADGLAADDRDRFIAAFGDAVINRRSTTWRGLSEAERAARPADLLDQHPTLMKRPVIESATTGLTLGWTPEIKARHLDR